MRWIQCLKSGLKRVNHAAVAIGDEIYSFGGFCDGPSLSLNMDVHVFNTSTLTWSEITADPSGVHVRMLYGHSAVLYGRKVYIWGGNVALNNEGNRDFLCYDTDSKKWSIVETKGQVPRNCDGHSACVINNFMYIFGGFETYSDCLVNNLYRLCLDTFKWERVWSKGTPPVARDFHTASAIGHRMYIFGGRSCLEDDDTTYMYYNEMMYFDTQSLTWEKPNIFSDEPRGRRSHSAVVYNEEIYVFGGCSPQLYTDSELHLNDLHKFNPVLSQWTRLTQKGRGPNPRRRHSAVVIADQMYLFGGSCFIYDDLTIMEEKDDIYIMDFTPTLKRLCQLKVLEYDLWTPYQHILPQNLQADIELLKKDQTTIRTVCMRRPERERNIPMMQG